MTTAVLLMMAAVVALARPLRDLCRPPARHDLGRTVEQRDMDDRAYTHATLAPPAPAPIGASGASPTDLLVQAVALRAKGRDGAVTLAVRPCDRRAWTAIAGPGGEG